MTQKAGAATVNAEYNEAQRQAQTDKSLYDLGVISGLQAKASAGKAQEMVTRDQIEDDRLKINQRRSSRSSRCSRRRSTRCGRSPN